MLNIEFDSKDVKAMLAELQENAKPMAEEIIKNIGTIAQNAARNTVPVDTGKLKQSITLEVVDEGEDVAAYIGSDLPYAVFVEYGTSKQPPQAFLQPAAAIAEAQLSNVMDAVVNKYVK